MSSREGNILVGLNKIFGFLGCHGGTIEIEDEWKFSCAVNDLGGGDYEAEISSIDDEENIVQVDPFFRINIIFDESRKKVVAAKPIEYVSQGWMGTLYIDRYGNFRGFSGETGCEEDELEERLENYIDNVTNTLPYLTNPVRVERFEEDSDKTYLNTDPDEKKAKLEAMERMRLLGIDAKDMEKFGRGIYTFVSVDHEKKRYRKTEATQEDMEFIKKALEEYSIPVLPYYIISDTITWPQGEVNRRYIIPYVEGVRADIDNDDEEREFEDTWKRERKDMLLYGTIPCYTINADIPEYSEFGELSYQVINGTLIAS